MPYNFKWSVDDEASGNHYSHSAKSDGLGVLTGSYSVLLPDGRLQIVSYNADDVNGYVASIKYEDSKKSAQEIRSGQASTIAFAEPLQHLQPIPAASSSLLSFDELPVPLIFRNLPPAEPITVNDNSVLIITAKAPEEVPVQVIVADATPPVGMLSSSPVDDSIDSLERSAVDEVVLVPVIAEEPEATDKEQPVISDIVLVDAQHAVDIPE